MVAPFLPQGSTGNTTRTRRSLVPEGRFHLHLLIRDQRNIRTSPFFFSYLYTFDFCMHCTSFDISCIWLIFRTLLGVLRSLLQVHTPSFPLALQVNLQQPAYTHTQDLACKKPTLQKCTFTCLIKWNSSLYGATSWQATVCNGDSFLKLLCTHLCRQ